jgi:putative ABC transport system substrate-binding protein
VASGGVPATMAAKRATRSIPIVMTEGADPVRTGLVASLARPGGNVTGVTAMAPDIVKKRLQLLKEAAPKISRVAVLIHPSFPGTLEGMKEARAGAPTLGLTVVPLEMGGPNELEDALATITRLAANALLGFGDPFIEAHRRQVIALAAKSGLPAIYSRRDFVEDGGLIAYGPNYDEMVRRAASYVDKILKGAKPADLPIEQPRKFELAINLKTAKALGLTIPPSLLLRADQVIE